MAPPPNRPKNKRPRRRHREFKAVPEAEEEILTSSNGNLAGVGDDAFSSNNDFISIGGKDTTNEGIAKSRKRKREIDEAEEKKVEEGKKMAKDGGDDRANGSANKASKNKKKKERREGGKRDDGAATSEGGEEGAQVNGQKSNARFIVFVGNLPYDTTQESLSTHLAPVKPSSIRLATPKAGSAPNPRSRSKSSRAEVTCKGYAFVEFSDAGRMKTCLQMFHHSLFNGRKINVELTAGGGGKSEERKEKVRVKNEKLNEERKRRFEEEKKKKGEEKKAGEGGDGEEKKQEEVDDGIHPSRRKRVRR
ncbi:hypothetical protein ABW19_dt0209474 [Dactylella cylindrospora]|nr:hypothetical protein ABW19_dt0209474 [Dactylella cylindrospora]